MPLVIANEQIPETTPYSEAIVSLTFGPKFEENSLQVANFSVVAKIMKARTLLDGKMEVFPGNALTISSNDLSASAESDTDFANFYSSILQACQTYITAKNI